jgi:hypothetical protein
MKGVRPTAFVVAVAVLGLTACSRGGLAPEQVQAWVGRPASDLIRAWGAPTREIDDAGQRVMIYEEIERNRAENFEKTVTARQAGSVAAAEAANAAMRGATVYARSYLFWIDAAGAIVRAQIRQP